MKRTRLSDRTLPSYTRGEEIANMVTHILGGALGIWVLLSCLCRSASRGDAWDVVGSSIYGAGMILLYTVSSVYHGLRPNLGKKVMQVLDHCTIYFLIGATYTPILLSAIRPGHPAWAWTIFGLVWGCAALGTVFTAIDLKKFSVLSMSCYIGMGWCIVLAIRPALDSMPREAFLWILAGGIAYTVGAVLYGLGKRRRYLHTLFHVFVLLGSLLQYLGIFLHIL